MAVLSPEAQKALRLAQVEFQYVLHKHLVEKETTVDAVAALAQVSAQVVEQLASASYCGPTDQLYAVALAIGKVPKFEFADAPVTKTIGFGQQR